MATKRGSIDFIAPFKLIFDDKKWPKKLVIATLLPLTLIMAPAAAGWALEISKKVIAGKKPILPQWDQIGQKWSQGVSLSVASFLWLSPFFLGLCCFNLVISTNAYYGPTTEQSVNLGLSLALTAFINLVFTTLQTLALGFYSETNSISETLQIRRGLQLLWVNFLQFLGFAVLNTLLSMSITFMRTPLMSWFLTIIYSSIVLVPVSHIKGQIFRNANLRLAARGSGTRRATKTRRSSRHR